MTLSFALAQPARGVLNISGEDRATFLQGLISNDTTKLTSDRGLWAAFLTPQGKYLFDFMLTETGDRILLEGDAATIGDLKTRLLRFKLRSKIAIDDISESVEVWHVWGDGTGDALGFAEAGEAKAIEGGTALLDPRLAELGARLVLPAGSGSPILTALGMQPGDIADWNGLRLRLGIPEGGQDLVQDKAILLESGFDELNGVSFTKGCFMGQELTARTKYRALIKKRLLPVTFDGAAPTPGTLVTQEDGREAGEIMSGQDGVALALLRLEALRPSTRLFAEGTTINPLVPGWVTLPSSS